MNPVSGQQRRVLLVNYEYPPVGGGAATATEAIAKALVDLGHRVVVLTGRFNDLPALSEQDGIIIRRIPSLRRAIDRTAIFEMTSFLIAGLMFVPGLIRKHQIDATIVFFSLPCGPIGLLGRWIKGVPYIVSLRGGDVPGTEPSLEFFHRLLTSLRRVVMKHCVAVVANSEGLKEMAEGVDPFPVKVIPNGIDTDLFRPAQPARLTPARNFLRILFVGRFQEQKNLEFLLRQLIQLPPGTFELHLVGDGPLAPRLRSLADHLGLSTRVVWHGWVRRGDRLEIYQSADCFVNPSFYEGLPNVVLEAMACGLPVIASNVPGNDTLVLHGETGFLFDLNDSAGFVSAMTQLQDAKTRLRMGQASRVRALQLFSWKTVALQYMKLFARAHDG